MTLKRLVTAWSAAFADRRKTGMPDDALRRPQCAALCSRTGIPAAATLLPMREQSAGSLREPNLSVPKRRQHGTPF
jgi:hypothetical protein